MQDWLTQSLRSQSIQAQNKAAAAKPSQAKTVANAAAQPKAAAKSAQKLGYKEQRELDGLPALIEALEKEQTDIRTARGDSSLFANDPAKAAALFARDAQIDSELESALERWEILS